MADQTTKDAIDTGRDDAADTSNNEDTSADFDDDPDNAGWSDGEDDGQDDASKDDSAATEEDDDDGFDSEADGDSEDKEESEDEDDSSEDEADDSADSKTDDAPSVDKALEAERKKHNEEMAAARVAERQARAEAEASRVKAQEATIDRYLEEAGDDNIERQRRELDVQQFRIREDKIEINNDRLQAGIEKAVASIELFRTANPVVQEELASSLDDFEAKFVVKDKQGRPVEIRIDPITGKQADVFQYLQRKADSVKRLTGIGATQQDKSKSKQQTRTLTPPVKAPKKPKTDADMDAFDEEANRY